MAEDLRPEEAAGRTFRSVFRGYDPQEVSAHLADLSRRIAGLTAERDRMASRLTEMGERDLRTEFQSVAREVGAVLEAAREAAESMRERAAADAARWRSEAVAEAEAELRRARADAESLRSDAWTTAEKMLEQTRIEAEVQADRARQEALRIQGEAEREAHRLTASSRRESEDLVRSSRMDAERIALEAKKEHDELIDRARRQAEAAQERARALEQRRDELMQEIESVRASLSAVESELEDRRERVGLSEDSSTVKVVRPAQYEEIGEGDWDLGETIRVIPAHDSGSVDEPPVSSEGREPFRGEFDEPSSTVRLVRSTPAPPAPEAPAPPPETIDEPPEPEPVEQRPVHEPPAEQPEPAPARQPEETAEVPPVPEEEPAPPVEPVVRREPPRGNEIDALFASLRTPATETPIREETRTEAVVDADAVAVADADSVAGLDEPDSVGVPDAEDAIARRDELLLPITNRALRGIKRQLTDAQNEALEEIRLHGAEWAPSVDDIRSRLRPDLVVLMTESFGAGYVTAEDMLGETVSRPPAPHRDETEDLARDLVAALVYALEEGVASEQGPRELGAGISRVFRAWRTDEAERRVRDLSMHAYHEGVQATVAGQGTALRWVASGRGCASCRAAAERPVTEVVPPLHPGCTCTVVV